MQNWTPEMWQATLIGVLIGFVVGYLFIRLTKGSVKKQAQTENELSKVKKELSEQKQQLEQHFAQSAELLKTLAQDYQKLYRHLATSANHLLPESADKSLFTAPSLENRSEIAKEQTNTLDDIQQPHDYSEGSSGILKAER